MGETEEMDDLYRKLQIYLMRKQEEYGQLRFLASRTTTQNFNTVQEICDMVDIIFSSCKISTKENISTNDPKCVQAFKYLLLNTTFESQEHLTEDPSNGHLVDMCPSLSPYLLAEICWSINYEEIVAESILHIPLDLAVELIEISKRCLHLLDFNRGINFLSLMTLNSYKLLRLIDKNGALTMMVGESPEKLMIYYQELMAFFCDSKFTRINEVTGLRKSERHGIILKRLLNLSKNCLDSAKNGVTLSAELSSLYKLTYGREPYKRMNENFRTQLGMLDHEFVHNLLKKLTDIDVSTYIDWVSLEDSDNTEMSFQRSLGIDCYNFMEFIKNYENLIKVDTLIQCLQQISSTPDKSEARTDLDLDDLCKGAIDGKMECLKELMKRYREWNHETFNVVRKYRSCLDKDDFFHLLEYLTHVMTKTGQEEHKRDVYTTVTKVLLQQDIKSVYETMVDYILMHDGRNILESSFTEDMFKKFMSHNKNFKSSTNLRLVLFFLVKNPRKILSMLVKMTIGNPEYENIMVTPNDLSLLSPIMNIREKRNETLIIVTLREICIAHDEWNKKKFLHLVRFMLVECVFTADDVVNNVFVPCLNEKTHNFSNVASVLNCLRQIIGTCTKETDFEALLVTLARKMSELRCDRKLRKYSISQTLFLVIRIVNILWGKIDVSSETEERMEFVEKIEKSLGPIDRHHFAKFLLFDRIAKIDAYDTIKDYERRCFTALTRIRHCRDITENDEKNESTNFNTNEFQDDYIRHVIVSSIESEYVKFAVDVTIFQWDMFNCENEHAAYEKIVRLTIEACIFCLEFPRSVSPDTMASLLKNLARFTLTLITIERIRDTKKCVETLIEHFRTLNRCIKETLFSSLYTNILVEMNNRNSREAINDKSQDLVLLIDNFGNKCLDISHDQVDFKGEPSNEAKRYKISHDFITEIISLDPADENNSSLCRIYKLLCRHRTHD